MAWPAGQELRRKMMGDWSYEEEGRWTYGVVMRSLYVFSPVRIRESENQSSGNRVTP